MALVKAVAGNLFAGANLQKLEVGAMVEIDDGLADRWKSAGLVEIVDNGDRKFEAATPDKDEQPAKSRKAK